MFYKKVSKTTNYNLTVEFLIELLLRLSLNLTLPCTGNRKMIETIKLYCLSRRIRFFLKINNMELNERSCISKLFVSKAATEDF